MFRMALAGLETLNFPASYSSDVISEEDAMEEMLKYVCNLYDGRVQLEELLVALGPDKCTQLFGGSKPEIFFAKYTKLFQLDKKGGGWVVAVKPVLRMCGRYLSEAGCKQQGCSQLHICRFFIVGNCHYSGSAPGDVDEEPKQCSRPHSFHEDQHNGQVLKSNGLDKLDFDLLKSMTKIANPRYVFPSLCRYYSSADGCKWGNACAYGLHLCPAFASISELCRQKNCPYSHRVYDEQPKRVLEKYAVDTTLPSVEITKMIQRKLSLQGQTQRDNRPPGHAVGPGMEPLQSYGHQQQPGTYHQQPQRGRGFDGQHNNYPMRGGGTRGGWSGGGQVEGGHGGGGYLGYPPGRGQQHQQQQQQQQQRGGWRGGGGGVRGGRGGGGYPTGRGQQQQIQQQQQQQHQQPQHHHQQQRGGRGGGAFRGGRGGGVHSGTNTGKGGQQQQYQQQQGQRGRGGRGGNTGGRGAGGGVRPPSPGHQGKMPRAPSLPDIRNLSVEPPTQQQRSEVICIQFLVDRCKKGERCTNLHFPTPFMWQRRGSPDWENFPEDLNSDLEKQFCDVTRDKPQISTGDSSKLIVDFNKMLAIDLTKKKTCDLRRLSTVSTVSSKQKLATEWIWYWKGEAGWCQYGEQGGKGSATIRSADIEQKYQTFKKEGAPLTVQFSVGLDDNFDLNFGQMNQSNIVTSKKKDVRRRPKFISVGDIENYKKEMASKPKKSAQKKNTPIPQIDMKMKNWDKTADDKGGYSIATLSEVGDTSAEYNEVISLFQKTMPGALIVSIERVQNDNMWDFFAKRYIDLKGKTNDGNFDVRHLFHGTTEKFVDVICRQNFDWRLSGSRVGTKFGKGSYFAETAKYSDLYVATDDLYKKMFMARVLVGEFAQGKPEYVRPPPKNPNNPLGALYDSCVNNTSQPAIYVVFDMTQAYPEYIITYIRQADMENM